MPAVTIVIPIYNALRKSPAYLPDAIDSVLGQTFTDFELILVDDGSSEDYSFLMRQYQSDKRVRWVRIKNSGQSAARNFGASAGTGQWLAFLDQDDRWYPYRLEETLRVMLREKSKSLGPVMVYSDLDEIDSNSHVTCRKLLTTKKLGVHPKLRLEDVIGVNAYVLPGTMLVDRQAFLNMGGFDERLSGFEDDDLARRFFCLGGLVYINKPLIQWRIYQESYSYSTRMDKSRDIYWDILTEAHPDDKNMGRYWVRDVLAPRFYSELRGALLRAVVFTRNPLLTKSIRANMTRMSSFYPWRLRLRLRLLALLPPSAIRIVMQSGLLKRLARRIA